MLECKEYESLTVKYGTEKTLLFFWKNTYDMKEDDFVAVLIILKLMKIIIKLMLIKTMMT